MPPHPRTQVPVGRVYHSTPVQEQIKFPARKKSIKYRRRTRSPRRSRQETLTQMDFANLQMRANDEDENQNSHYEAQEEKRKRKRRRTTGNEIDASKHHTQTLTQLNFVSTPAPELLIPEDEKTGEVELADDTTNTKAEEVSYQAIGPPKTPTRVRNYEIPSSQSPADSLFSVHGRSPLKEKEINTLPLPKFHPVQIVPELEIIGTFHYIKESQQTEIPSSPVETSSAIESVISADKLHPDLSLSKSMPQEIGDSEAESECDSQESEADEPPDEIAEIEKLSGEVAEPEIHYEELGPETQIELGQITKSPIETPSPYVTRREDDEESLASIPQPKEHISQWMESQYTQGQRLSTQQFENMAPRTFESDVFVSIHPGPLKNILSQTRDHDFRSYRLPESTSRVWFYETKPSSRVKYMAEIGEAKEPGEIQILKGEGNTKFNASKRRRYFAYEIFQVYELADPLSLELLKCHAWLETPPRTYSKVRPAVLDALMANLRYPLLGRTSPEQGTDTQDAEAQLQSTMLQFTQQYSPQTNAQRETPRPSQATTVDLTQSSNLEIRDEMDSIDNERDESVVPESPTNVRQIVSSPILPQISSRPIFWDMDIPVSISSELLTCSQMLPESLLNDSLPPPPEFIDDSEDTEDPL